MRTITTAFAERVAHRVQERAFLAGIFAGLAFIGFAVADRAPLAAASALLLVFALGVSVGAWVVGHRFK